VRNADPLGDVARVVNILPGAAGALAVRGRTMIVKLQRDADDVVTFRLQQRGRHGRIDAAGHGDNDARVLRTAFEVQTVEHGSSAHFSKFEFHRSVHLSRTSESHGTSKSQPGAALPF